MTESEKEVGKEKGISKEAWAAISAIVVALIGGGVTVATTLLNKQPTPTPPFSAPPIESSTSSPTLPNPVQRVSPPQSHSAQRLAQDLNAVNIDFSGSKERANLSNKFSNYPQFAEGCLKLLNNQLLKNKVYFDVIFWNYTEELGGKVTTDSPDGDLNTIILKTAMVSAYNTRNGSSALSFGDIVEPKQ